MNTNIFLQCDVCNSIINLKCQIGFLEHTNVKISCGKCKTSIKGILNIKNEDLKIDFNSKNAQILKARPNNIDFYVDSSGEFPSLKMSANPIPFLPSPFIRGCMLIGNNKMSEFKHIYINNLSKCDYKHIYDRINNLYINKNYPYFINELNKPLSTTTNKKINSNSSESDLFEKMYYYNISYLSSFIDSNKFSYINKNVINKNFHP